MLPKISKSNLRNQLIIFDRLLLDFANSEFSKLYEVNFKRAKILMNLFIEKQISIFNPFFIAGFKPNENNFSDVIAELLNPKGRHGLGNRVLKIALINISHRAGENVKRIINEIDSGNYNVLIKREGRREESRPDIVISSNKFIIYIENKLRKGTETYISGKYQTHRQFNDLVTQSKQFRIPFLGLYLTAEGKSPKNINFLPIAANELALSIKQAINDTPCCDSRSIIEAFLDFYTWSNQLGGI